MSRNRRHSLPTGAQCQSKGCKALQAPQSTHCHACGVSKGGCTVRGCSREAIDGGNWCEDCRIHRVPGWRVATGGSFAEHLMSQYGEGSILSTLIRRFDGGPESIQHRMQQARQADTIQFERRVISNTLGTDLEADLDAVDFGRLETVVNTVPDWEFSARELAPTHAAQRRALERMGRRIAENRERQAHEYLTNQIHDDTWDPRTRPFQDLEECTEAIRNAPSLRSYPLPAAPTHTVGRVESLIRELREQCGAQGPITIMCDSDQTAERIRAGLGDHSDITVSFSVTLPGRLNPFSLSDLIQEWAFDNPPIPAPPVPREESFADWQARTARELEHMRTRESLPDSRPLPPTRQGYDGDGDQAVREPDSIHDLVGQVLKWGGNTDLEE